MDLVCFEMQYINFQANVLLLFVGKLLNSMKTDENDIAGYCDHHLRM